MRVSGNGARCACGVVRRINPVVRGRIQHVATSPQDTIRYFTEPDDVRWMGSEARLEPVPGGVFHLVVADGFRAAGDSSR